MYQRRIYILNFLIIPLVFIATIFVFTNPVSACTSIFLDKQDHLVFGNNLDWFIDDALLVINKRNVKKRGAWGDNRPQWISKYGSITTNLRGNGFPNRGMNEAGLVVGEMWLGATEYPDPDSRPSVEIAQWIQYQLDNCATVEQVLATDKVLRIGKEEYKSHFFVCDANGGCAVVEWLDGKLSPHIAEEVKVKALVNTPYAECLAKGDDPTGRFAKAARMLENYSDEEPIEYVFSILRTTRQSYTRWHLVFDVKNRRLHYSTERNPKICTVNLLDFDLSCKSPVQIIDINADGSGDVTKGFVPFTHEENARIVRIVLEKLKTRYSSMSEEDINTTLNYHKTMQPLPQLQGAVAIPEPLSSPPSKQTCVYKTVGDCNIHADVYRPADKMSRPVILWLHGGALIWGSRTSIPKEQITRYVREGFIVVAIDYRLAPETKLPAILDDLKDAYTWIRSKGPGLFQADPSRIAVVGHSAGGYLTLMAGFLMDSPPRALVSFYGYGDIGGKWYNQPDPYYSRQPAISKAEADGAVGDVVLTEAPYGKRWPFYLYCRQQGRWVQEVVGEQTSLERFCPVRHVTQGFPPTLFLHGDKDTDVPYEQSVQMAGELKDNGVVHELIILPDRGHAFEKFGEGLNDPVVADAFERAIRFLKQNLTVQEHK